MAKVGGALFQGNSDLWAGPLGVVQIGFEGYDLGKTTADANLTPDQDVKDIMYQQEGTKAADHVRTGLDYILNVTFGEIKTGLLVRLMAGISTQNTSVLDDDGTISRQIYQSMLSTEAGPLRVVAVDADGVPSEDDPDILQFYEAIPIITGELVNWGADTQRNLPVQFRIKWHRFATGESATKNGAYGYWGDPTSEDVPAVTWPDVAAPVLTAAEADTATNMDLTFDEDVAFQGGAFVSGSVIAYVNGIAVLGTAGSIASNVASITFPAATFASGDTIEVYITDQGFEDTDATANEYGGVDGFSVTNSVP